MLRRSSRRRLFAGLALASVVALVASCDALLPKYPKQLADGCYYAHGKAVFQIAGQNGRVLIPGTVKTFKVERGGNPYRAWATFSPGILFDNSDAAGAPASIDWEAADGSPGTKAVPGPLTFSMEAGTPVPTIHMYWSASGDEDVSLGKSCKAAP